ncbi:nucleoside-diphosphate sugar epimerase [Anoxybacter fermentans]|uniref:Nucleoside-diphosphate sugar epimerase n=2 Tax=Anoxybacter fermentans TaxID=1323375 RepID=A0A3S9T2Y4_9FIRM|nr:nucleoside-diphosphate sugar epimerase [Anoxybacter fermentans]
MLLLICDIVFIQISLLLSFILRFEGTLPNGFWKLYGPLIIPITVFKIGAFIFSNLYKKVWRYANLHELVSIIQGVTLGSVILVGYVFFFRVSFPRSIIILDWMTTIMLIGGSRFFLRIWKEYSGPVAASQNAKRVLIVGAGDAGEMVLKEYKKHKELNTRIVGFIDDDPAKLNLEIHGVRVLGNRNKIPYIIKRYNVDEVIIAIPSASGKEIREIHKLCSKNNNVTVRILPGVYEIINGDVSLNQIREVQVEDLLGREPVKINMEEVAAYLTGKTVLITGGGGSIGSELCRQVARFDPEKLIIFDISENNVYDIELELKERYKHLNIIPVIGSIRDMPRLRQVFKKYRPDVVFHAAAHKHVPLMEYNPEEAVKNNIFGTRNVALAADEFGVERFVMISTDKAVNPTNVMGATKRVAEMIIQDINKRSKTKFVAVRFGNVLGSRGSVIPLFKKQIAQGGPVTVTHPEITRYFMTIPEASQLVIQAGALGQGGEVFVLDMGKPVKIIDLARDLIELSGLKVGEDIEIKITGLRPGEKLYEELLSDKEETLATKHERILIAKMDEFESKLLREALEQMEQIIASSISDYLLKTLVKLVATFKPDRLHESVLYKKNII